MIAIRLVAMLAVAQDLRTRHRHISLHHACGWARSYCDLRQPASVLKHGGRV